MTSVTDIYLATKFVWDKSPTFRQVRSLDACGLGDMPTLNTRYHSLASPLVLKIPRISHSAKQDTFTLTRRLAQPAKGRFVLQFESPPFEWWDSVLGLCQHIPIGGALQVSRPQCVCKVADTVELHLPNVFKGVDRLCFLSDVMVEDSCAHRGILFASFVGCCRIQLKFLLCDIFSIASLVRLCDLPTRTHPFPCLVEVAHWRLVTEQLKTIFVLVPFKLDRDTHPPISAIPDIDIANLVGRLFAPGRLEVTDATLVIWGCYPREIVDHGSDSEIMMATRCQLCKELEPHVERLRELELPVRTSECGEPSRASPFRKVDLRICSYEEWHEGGIAEIPGEV